jgi:hypothetical protein
MLRCHNVVVALAVALAAAASAQPATQGARIAGTVKSVTANDLILTTAKGDIDVAVTPQTRVLRSQQGAASDVKPGAYLGTSNQDGATPGTGTATEIHLMENGPNVNYPMNNSGLTMTNGHVKSVTQTANGQEMEVDYGQAATRHVTVTKDTNISRMVEVGLGGLAPGVAINARGTTGPNGKLTATFISITSVAKSVP